MRLPEGAEKFEVKGATVDFYRFTEEGKTCYLFDSSYTACPEPMINAFCGLRLIDAEDKKLIMLNHLMPSGLLRNIGEQFDVVMQELDDGRYRLQFSYRPGISETADLANPHCDG